MEFSSGDRIGRDSGAERQLQISQFLLLRSGFGFPHRQIV